MGETFQPARRENGIPLPQSKNRRVLGLAREASLFYF
jgi:hypothetical protein